MSLTSGAVQLTQTLTVSRAVTIKSADSNSFAILIGAGLPNPAIDHILRISGRGSEVVLEELFIQDAKDSAFVTDSELRLNSVTIRDNTASDPGATIRYSGMAICVNESTFAANAAVGNGGAIHHSGSGGKVIF